jgi:hypothetical protein
LVLEGLPAVQAGVELNTVLEGLPAVQAEVELNTVLEGLLAGKGLKKLRWRDYPLCMQGLN